MVRFMHVTSLFTDPNVNVTEVNDNNKTELTGQSKRSKETVVTP